MINKTQQTRRAQRREHRAERRREEERQREAKRRLTLWSAAIAGAIVIIITVLIINNLRSNATATGSNTNAPLASDNPAYPVVDNIACQTSEQLAYHIHAHLSMYINGQPFSLPANIGIASDGSCIYWLHTHDGTGVVHIESPNSNTYSLGTFFKMWEDHFSQLGYPSQLNSTNGWTIYVDGKPYTGDFHNIQLLRHRLITMAYNSPKVTPDTTYSWGVL